MLVARMENMSAHSRAHKKRLGEHSRKPLAEFVGESVKYPPDLRAAGTFSTIRFSILSGTKMPPPGCIIAEMV